MKKFLKTTFNIILLLLVILTFLILLVSMIDFSIFSEDFTNIYKPE